MSGLIVQCDTCGLDTPLVGEYWGSVSHIVGTRIHFSDNRRPCCVTCDACDAVDKEEDDGGAASERRMLAGMAHGNQGLADLAGLDISEEFDRPWDCAYDPAWTIG